MGPSAADLLVDFFDDFLARFFLDAVDGVPEAAADDDEDLGCVGARGTVDELARK